MPFSVNDSRINRNGRKPGAVNKTTSAALQTVTTILEGQSERFLSELETIKGRNFCDLFVKLLALVIPKTADLSITSADAITEFLKLEPKQQAEVIGEKLREIENETN